MKYLHDRLQEDELNIQQVKGLNAKVVKSFVTQVAVSNFLLEDQLRVAPSKAAEIKSQLAIHKVKGKLLEPMDFKTIDADASTWKQFVKGLAGSA